MKCKTIPILISLLFSLTLLSLAYAQPQIGEETPGFITSTLDGKQIALKDYWAQQGKKVLVFSFFATWCQPCKEDLKYLQKIQDKNADKRLRVLAVLTQDSSKEDRVRIFTTELGVTLSGLMDEFLAACVKTDKEVLFPELFK